MRLRVWVMLMKSGRGHGDEGGQVLMQIRGVATAMRAVSESC